MTWQQNLIVDLENVAKGKHEAGEDDTQVRAAIDAITNDTIEQDAATILSQYNLNHFAGLVMTGNYHRQTEAEKTDEPRESE